MRAATRLGASYSQEGKCRFEVWAPNAQRVEVLLGMEPTKSLKLAASEKGYHVGEASGVKPGSLYRFQLDGKLQRPDPASFWQPKGVHGPSAVLDSEFPWTDGNWKGLALEGFVIYELHVGTFTPEGTFAGVERRLESLRELGITAVELMPVAQFPGKRNWGYDGVYPFAVQESYGGPQGLKHLVNAAHRVGLAVVLDVVYNHLGPEGNYLSDFGPYFTTRYQTPWGASLNFDGPHSDEVRRFFIENAVRWVEEFHFDALRLDAVHAIIDNAAVPFLRELTDAVHASAAALDRQVQVIAETDANDPRVCAPSSLGGLGFDAQWSDDLHHAIHTVVTKEQRGYYADFGTLDQWVTGLRDGYVFQGQYSPFRKRRYGASPKSLSPRQFVVCSQNHDQVGNRMLGERLTTLVPFETTKLAAGVVILSPFIPLLFMGEEYGEIAPFQYFVDHSDPPLIEAVRRGRREEFAAFAWKGEPPDPQDKATFARSKLDHKLAESGRHAALLGYYRELLRLRATAPALAVSEGASHEVTPLAGTTVIAVKRSRGGASALLLLNVSEQDQVVDWSGLDKSQHVMLDSADERWGGPGCAPSAPQLRPWSMKVILSEGTS